MFRQSNAIEHAFTTLDQGIERGKQLQANQPQWNQGKRRIHAYTSELDEAVLPYGVTLPDNTIPASRLDFMSAARTPEHTTETEFIYGFLSRRGAGIPPVADRDKPADCFGRINGAGWHWPASGCLRVLAAVKKRFSNRENGVMIRDLEGGEGALAPLAVIRIDRGREIGAGTVRALPTAGLTPYQLATLRSGRNIPNGPSRSTTSRCRSRRRQNDPAN